MTTRRGFLGAMTGAAVAIFMRRDASFAESEWEEVEINGVLVADDGNKMDYEITVNGKKPSDCLRVCPKEGWYEVLVHADGKDDFDWSAVPMLDGKGDIVKAIRRGPVKVWKRRAA